MRYRDEPALLLIITTGNNGRPHYHFRREVIITPCRPRQTEVACREGALDASQSLSWLRRPVPFLFRPLLQVTQGFRDMVAHVRAGVNE